MNISENEKYKTLKSVLATNKYYRASSGIMKYLICEDTKKKIIIAPTEEQFLQDVEKFFR